MNELDIKANIDKLIANAETQLEEVFARMLKEILSELNQMYVKYGVQGREPSWTDVNKYNRLHNVLERITQTMTDEYRVIVKQLQKLEQTAYIETYLQEAYMIEVFESMSMGFKIPTMETINAALLNPIEFLRLPKVMQEHRNEVTRQIQLIVTQSLIRGEGYYNMAKEIEEKLGFFQKKARAVARTEGGRAMSIADETVFEQASKYVKVEKVWCSALDLRVRASHRTLDGQKADNEGYFHYRSLKAKMPHGWNRADMDINCRCVTIKLVNGMYPTVRRGRNYKDPEYQDRLQTRIDELMKKEKLTFAQALNKASYQIQPPHEKVPYMTYNEWYKQKVG
ncbi:phage minor head protein [Lysinibacillus halotolerans]